MSRASRSLAPTFGIAVSESTRGGSSIHAMSVAARQCVSVSAPVVATARCGGNECDEGHGTCVAHARSGKEEVTARRR